MHLLTSRTPSTVIASAQSTHAKRQAALADEIASFEAENVGQKDWTLMGEASARGRPKNSLLEEDLDFERMGGARAAPVVTEDATKSLEDKIKARILEVSFDTHISHELTCLSLIVLFDIHSLRGGTMMSYDVGLSRMINHFYRLAYLI